MYGSLKQYLASELNEVEKAGLDYNMMEAAKNDEKSVSSSTR